MGARVALLSCQFFLIISAKYYRTTYSTRPWRNRKCPEARTYDEHETTRHPSSLPRTNISERLQFAYGYMHAKIRDIRL